MASQELINIIIKATDEASATASKVDDNLRKIGSTASSVFSKVPGFDTFKSKISGVASTLKSKLGGAVDGVRSKLSSLANGAKGLESAMGFLKGAVSMTAGMIGFELVQGFIEAGRAAINASSQLDYFGQRLQNASGKTKMSAQQFSEFKGELSDLQKEFRKVDMTAVGATAEEIALKMNLPSNKLSDLTKMTAVLSSTFVKEGRSQEDAVLAVGDALDGQFKRLQEIGITQEELKNNGWSGDLEDQAGLIDALNKTMEDMGYEQTAKDITNLDEAFTALSIAGGQLLASVLIPITPALISIMEAVMSAMDQVKPFIQTLQGAWNALPDWLKDTAWAVALVLAIYLIGTAVVSSLIPALAAATLAMIDFTIAMLANPFTWIVIAVVAVALAIYELGKAFGWWEDVGGMLDAIWAGLMNVYNTIMSNSTVQEVIRLLGDAFNWVVSCVNNAINIFNQFRTGQMDLPTFIMTVLTSLANAYNTIFTTIIGLVVKFASMLLQRGIQAATRFVNGIINRIRQLPGRVYSALLSVVSRISSAIQAWISTASAKVQGVISAITSPFSGVAGAISGALSGVASAITAPFQAAWDRLKPLVDKIKDGMKLIGAAGGEPLAAGGETAITSNGQAFNISTGQYIVTGDNTPLVIEDNINLTLDLRNVPRHIDTDSLIVALSDKNVLNAIASNRDFQNIDANVKRKLNLKNMRSG